MSLLVQRTASGVRKTGLLDYQAISDDPHFVYRFWFRRPHYLVLFLESEDHESLDPKIYADRGNGFDEGNAVSLMHAGAGIYSISIAPPRQVARIRIDPCSCEGRWRYWAKFAWNESDLAELIAAAKQLGAAETSVYNVVIDGTRQKRQRRKAARRVADHFASVVRLAEQTAPPVDPDVMRDAPFISFVVPLYNTSQACLDDLLESFHSQPAGAAELILCDDGSTSAQTRSWLVRHDNARDVRIIRHQQNRGIALVTNSGIVAARGEWIGLVDHDDALTPCVVQLVAQTARDHPGCKFIYTDESHHRRQAQARSVFFQAGL